MRRLIMMAAAGAALIALAAPTAANDNKSNWHIHDVPPGGSLREGHLPTAFFPGILGISLDAYLEDPATCPNATDKGLLPSGHQAHMPLRAGVCFTSDAVIHLRTIGADEQAPRGAWTLLGPTDLTAGGGPWYTYYLVTDR